MQKIPNTPISMKSCLNVIVTFPNIYSHTIFPEELNYSQQPSYEPSNITIVIQYIRSGKYLDNKKKN